MTDFSPTADDLSTLKVAAVNAVRAYLVRAKEELELGMRLGFLADSALDGLPADPSYYDLRAYGFTAASGYGVIVRAECSYRIQDFVAVPELRPGSLVAWGWSIREDVSWNA